MISSMSRDTSYGYPDASLRTRAVKREKGMPASSARPLELLGVHDLLRVGSEGGERVAQESLRALSGDAPPGHAFYLAQNRGDLGGYKDVRQAVPIGDFIARRNAVEAVEHLYPAAGLPREARNHLDQPVAGPIPLAQPDIQSFRGKHHGLFEEIG
jgi:hypothetical protein